MKWPIPLAILILPVLASAMDLNQFLQQVGSKHRGLQALEKQKEAAGFRRESGDIGLSPVLTAQVRRLDDKKPNYLGALRLDRTESTEYTLGLSKKFSSGTSAQLSVTTGESTVEATSFDPPPPSTLAQTFGVSSLGISLSQSLWKDAFGRATRLRQEREGVVEAGEKESYNLQQKQVLIEAESAYWDYLYLKEELAQRKDSLERARRIESWVRRRVSNGIGDEADLYNAQGLVANRELQLLAASDDLVAAEKKIKDLLELGDKEPLPELTGDLAASRNLEQMSTGRGRRLRLDSYLAVLEAKTRALAADEVEDAYRPDLVLEGQYKTNAVESTMSEANNKISNTDTPTSAVALRLSWALDGDLKNAARQTARSEALAAALRKERKILESDSSWTEINRRHSELTKKIQAAAAASLVQTKKANAERDKLSKGRTITSQVITAEEDAAEAQLTLSKLRAEQRKLEAQGRMFVTVEE
jgi:outer membrane protein TolC